MQIRKQYFTLLFLPLGLGIVLLSACRRVQALPTAPINDVSFEASDGSYRGPDSKPRSAT
jgi:hypothetical protein